MSTYNVSYAPHYGQVHPIYQKTITQEQYERNQSESAHFFRLVCLPVYDIVDEWTRRLEEALRERGLLKFRVKNIVKALRKPYADYRNYTKSDLTEESYESLTWLFSQRADTLAPYIKAEDASQLSGRKVLPIWNSVYASIVSKYHGKNKDTDLAATIFTIFILCRASEEVIDKQNIAFTKRYDMKMDKDSRVIYPVTAKDERSWLEELTKIVLRDMPSFRFLDERICHTAYNAFINAALDEKTLEDDMQKALDNTPELRDEAISNEKHRQAVEMYARAKKEKRTYRMIVNKEVYTRLRDDGQMSVPITPEQRDRFIKHNTAWMEVTCGVGGKKLIFMMDKLTSRKCRFQYRLDLEENETK